MVISTEKSKVMVNSNDNSIYANITLYGEKLEKVDKFCYLGSTLSIDGSCEAEIRIGLALDTSAMVRLYTIWNSKQITFKLTHNLYRSLVLSILTYGYETWTINAAMQKKIQAFENKSHRKLLGITYQERKTNVFVRNRIIEIIGNFEQLLQKIKRRKLKWIRHISRHDNLCKTIMQGSVDGSRIRGCPKQKWIDNIVKWIKKDVNCLIKDVHE